MYSNGDRVLTADGTGFIKQVVGDGTHSPEVFVELDRGDSYWYWPSNIWLLDTAKEG